MFLTGVSTPETRALGHAGRIGLMVQPRNSLYRQIEHYPVFAVDNDCFGDRFDPNAWCRLLDHVAPYAGGCLFAAVPDVVGDHLRTLDRWHLWHREVSDRGLLPAFVCQNGSTPDDVPWPDARAVFIGGNDTWKLSRWAGAHIAAAKARGRWTHIGRVNGRRRWTSASVLGAQSVDGTLVRHGPRAEMVRQLLAMIEQAPHLPFVP